MPLNGEASREDNHTHELDQEGNERHLTDETSHVSGGVRARELLAHYQEVSEAHPAADQERPDRRRRHDPQPPELDEPSQDPLSERREVLGGDHGLQNRYRYGAYRLEEGVRPRDAVVRRRYLEQQGPEQDEPGESEDNEPRSREPGKHPGAMLTQETPSASATSSPTSEGFVAARMPALLSASLFASAVLSPPETIAPAWPIVLPSGAVKPAM